jgi:hypothetical protein
MDCGPTISWNLNDHASSLPVLAVLGPHRPVAGLLATLVTATGNAARVEVPQGALGGLVSGFATR